MLTIHRSKGLEFPIVYCPYLWEPGYDRRRAGRSRFHDADAGDRRTIDVGARGPGLRRHRGQHTAEERGEDLRLAYVALTRARHQAVVWWAGSFDSRDSALGRLLFARDAGRHDRRRRRAHARRTTAAIGALRRRWPPRRRGCIARRARRRSAPPPSLGAGAAPRPPSSTRARFDRAARPALAAHVVQRHHRGRARGARGERARGDAS